MKRSLSRIRGAGFILWHARHLLYHVLLGLVWAWLLREIWQEFDIRFVLTSVFFALLPDVEHVWYFVTYGKSATYTQSIKNLIRSRQWRKVAVFIEHGHKDQTELQFHNIYTIGLLLVFLAMSIVWDVRIVTVAAGSSVIHYVFDIFDDVMILGYVNRNWTRWGKSD